MSSQTIFVTKGSTDVTVDVGPLLQDAGATTPGDPLTGLVYNSTGLVCDYREGATGTVTALTLATQTVGGAHSDGGFVLLNDTTMPGMYRLDLSDTIVSGTNDRATLVLSGHADLAAHTVHIVLTDLDLYDGVRAGLTALPNAAADAAGGLAISDAGGADLDTLISNVASILADTGTDGVVLANDAITAAKIADNSITSDQWDNTATTAIWAQVVETVGSRTAQQALSIILAAVAGVTANSGATIKDSAGTNTRIAATINGSNERTAMTLTPSS